VNRSNVGGCDNDQTAHNAMRDVEAVSVALIG
jgi:hypothetical protein